MPDEVRRIELKPYAVEASTHAITNGWKSKKPLPVVELEPGAILSLWELDTHDPKELMCGFIVQLIQTADGAVSMMVVPTEPDVVN